MKKSKNELVNILLTVIALLMPIFGGIIGFFIGLILFLCFKDCKPINTYAPYAASAGGAVLGLGISFLLLPKESGRPNRLIAIATFVLYVSFILVALLQLILGFGA